MRSPRVAVVGATGAVGPVVLEVLHQRGFPASEVVAFASARSAGSRVAYAGHELEVRELTADALEGFDLALFSAGGGTSRTFAPEAVARGCVVVDKSSAFRLDPNVPLVVPEVNGDDAAAHQGIVSNPNCSTIQLVCALAPLHAAAGLEHVTIATYQAVSGTGAKAVESQKILGDGTIGIHATCVRVPVWRGHSEAVWLETRTPLEAGEAREILRAAPGVRVVDDPGLGEYPLASDATTTDDVLVGRIRRDPSRRNGLALWIVADNLRKGAATNGVQIAELLVERDLVRVPGRAAA
jgi:aspartate-semialdehyde dehydrogenase